MNYAKWTAHFSGNQQGRPEPDWSAPMTTPAEMLGPLVKSIEQFRLGDGGRAGVVDRV